LVVGFNSSVQIPILLSLLLALQCEHSVSCCGLDEIILLVLLCC